MQRAYCFCNSEVFMCILMLKNTQGWNKMIEITDLSYKYKSEKEIIKNINLDIKDGEVVSIIRKKWFWKINTCKTYCRNNYSN